MNCPKCNADMGEEKICPNCGYEEAPVQDEEKKTEENTVTEVTSTAPAAAVNETPETPVFSNTQPEAVPHNVYTAPTEQPAKKSNKGKIIIIAVVAAVLVGVAALALILFGLGGSGNEYVERALFVKDNSLYYINPDDNTPILITDKFYDDEDDEDTSKLLVMNSVEFKQKGNKVFYGEKIDTKEDSFSLFYRMLNKPDEEPVKLAEDVVAFVVDEKGKNVIYLDKHGELYTHNLEERSKVISEAENMWVSMDCQSVLYLLEDGGLYIQQIGGEKDKIDSDVTSVHSVNDNLDCIYYYKDQDLYIKKADAEKIKIDSDILDVVLMCENGGVYYTKENEEKGTGTLMDYVKYPEDLQKKDEALIDDYYNDNWRARNEALYRTWSMEVLEQTEIETVDSLYYFNGETNELVNSSYVDYQTGNSAANTLIFNSYDKVNIKTIGIDDFVTALEKKYNFKKNAENGISLYAYEFKDYDYFDEFAKIVTGAMESDVTTYVIQNGKTIEIDTKGTNNSYSINSDGNKVYYIDNYDAEKEYGDLMIITLKDGAVESSEVYDSEVSCNVTPSLIDGEEIVYVKDYKEGTYDLYLSKQLIEYDVGRYNICYNDGSIIYYTELDEDFDFGILNIYKNGEKTKIAEEVHKAVVLENGDILYYQNYSTKSEKGDLYIYSNEESIRIDYDVTEIFTTYDGSSYNYVLSYASLWDDVELTY